MKNNIFKLLCISLTAFVLTGCSIIDILKESVKPKTNLEFEVAESFDDYAIITPFGNIMGGLNPRSRLKITYNNSECSIDCIDVSEINDLNHLNLGDQVKISFLPENFNKDKSQIRASNIEVTKLSELAEEQFGIYSLIATELPNLVSFETKEINDPYFFVTGICNWLWLRYPNGALHSLEVFSYATADEAKGDASNMSEDGHYNGNGMSNKEYYFQKGRLIVVLSTGFNDYESEKATYEFLVTNFGEPFAENHPEIDYFNQ